MIFPGETKKVEISFFHAKLKKQPVFLLKI